MEDIGHPEYEQEIKTEAYNLWSKFIKTMFM